MIQEACFKKHIVAHGYPCVLILGWFALSVRAGLDLLLLFGFACFLARLKPALAWLA